MMARKETIKLAIDATEERLFEIEMFWNKNREQGLEENNKILETLKTKYVEAN